MSLAKRLAAAAPVYRNHCGVVTVCRDLSKADRDAVTTAIGDNAWTAVAIARELRAEGHVITGNVIARHRRGDCSCGPRGLNGAV